MGRITLLTYALLLLPAVGIGYVVYLVLKLFGMTGSTPEDDSYFTRKYEIFCDDPDCGAEQRDIHKRKCERCGTRLPTTGQGTHYNHITEELYVLRSLGYSVKNPREDRWKLLTEVAVPKYGAGRIAEIFAAVIKHCEQPSNQPDQIDLAVHLEKWRHDLAQISGLR